MAPSSAGAREGADFVDWSLVTIMSDTMPPRDPNEDDDEDEEEEDEEGEDRHEKPPVVREPDE
jgi:hypothetical protein